MTRKKEQKRPWGKYLAEQRHKEAFAEYLAKLVDECAGNQLVDIGMLVHALQRGLWSTWKVTEELGISPRAFLRLRRKYGLRPRVVVGVDGSPHKVKYLYVPAQLSRIPRSEIEKSQRRRVLAQGLRSPKRRVIDAGIDLAYVFGRRRVDHSHAPLEVVPIP